ncbi:MAG: RodZ domain-containing protein [Kovacikia sp.]
MQQNRFTSTKVKKQQLEPAGTPMTEFDVSQTEKLRSIADRLRQERQEKAISLEEIAVKTFIPLRLLQALDTGHVDRLPEPVFVQGFIRRYADAVGLDGWALAKTFPTETAPPEPKIIEPEPPIPLSAPRSEERVVVAQPAPAAVPMHLNASDRARFPLSRVLGVTAIVLLTGGAVIALFNRPKSNTPPPPAQEETISQSPSPSPIPSPQLKSPSPQPAASFLPSPAASATPGEPIVTSSSNAPVQVAVNLKDGDSWIEVVADGKTEFQGTLKKGEQKTWTAQKTLVVISGNAGAVYVSQNQGEERKMGAFGEVKDETFSSGENKNPQEPTPAQTGQTNP